jgi:hypothetical protein
MSTIGPRPPGDEDRVIVENVDLGQLAAVCQALVCLAAEERCLNRVVPVEPVFGWLPAQRRCELQGDACFVEHIEGMGDLGKEEARVPLVRTNLGGVGGNAQDVGNCHVDLL